MPIEIEGLAAMKAALRETEGASTREITTQLRIGSEAVTARTKSHIHSKSGQLAADARPYATLREAGVRFTKVYAPVQEFATTWHRRPKGKGVGTHSGTLLSGRAGPKSRADRRILQAKGEGEVHYKGATPRFAHKAVDELAPVLMVETFERLVGVLKAHGWFTE